MRLLSHPLNILSLAQQRLDVQSLRSFVSMAARAYFDLWLSQRVSKTFVATYLWSSSFWHGKSLYFNQRLIIFLAAFLMSFFQHRHLCVDVPFGTCFILFLCEHWPACLLWWLLPNSSVLFSFATCKSCVNKRFFGIFWKCGDVCNLCFWELEQRNNLDGIKLKSCPLRLGFLFFLLRRQRYGCLCPLYTCWQKSLMWHWADV